MKFIPILIYEVIISIFKVIKKLLTSFKSIEKNDFYLILTFLSLFLSLFFQWFLIITLLTLLPVLKVHLSIHNGLINQKNMLVSLFLFYFYFISFISILFLIFSDSVLIFF